MGRQQHRPFKETPTQDPGTQRPPHADMLLIPQLLCLLGLALGTVHANPLAEVRLQRGNCPMFWYSFNGRCYKYDTTPTQTWVGAEMSCVSEDANLVSIRSEEEHNFVRALLRFYDPSEGPTWIGLSDCHSEGVWMWSNGSKVDYSLWLEGQPTGGSQNCVLLNYDTSGKWIDTECTYSSAIPSVCAFRT